MPVTTIRIGRYSTVHEGATGTLADGKLRGVRFDAVAGALWVWEAGVFAGKQSGTTPDVRLALYRGNAADSSTWPRLGRFANISMTVIMTGPMDGQVWERSIDFADEDPLALHKGALLLAGDRPVGAIIPAGNGIRHSQKNAADMVALDENFYDRTGTLTLPPATFGGNSASNQGHMTLWFRGDLNEKPETPVNRDPHDAIGTLTPLLEGDFRDLNGTWGAANGGADRGDLMSRYQVQVRRQSDGVTFWQPGSFVASTAEQTANRFSVAYGGTALVAGTTYEWRGRVQDRAGAWGDWSSWLAFTPSASGSVALAGTPTGAQQTVQPTPFQFTWSHTSALSTNAVEIRLKQIGIVVRTSPTIAKTVANGNTGSITWAETTWADLSWGGGYTYEVRARDTNNVWSAWSAGRTFTVDASPSVPASLTPAASQIVTSLPLLRFSFLDPDDTVATGLVAKVRIKDNAGAVLFTRAATIVSDPVGATKWAEYQTTAVDLASFATYRWDAYAGDGTVWSGGQTVEANAVKSAEAIFVYAQGPQVTITAPTEAGTVATATPVYTWSLAGDTESQKRAKLFAPGGVAAGADPLFDSGWIVDTAQQYTQPGGVLRNNTSYELLIGVLGATTALEGWSATRTFSLVYTAPAALSGISAAPYSYADDPFPTAIRVRWDPTTEPLDTWNAYRVYRDDIPDRPLLEIADPANTDVVDYLPKSGVEYTYTVTQVTEPAPGTVLESTPVTATAVVVLEGIVLSDVRLIQRRVVLAYVEERSHQSEGAETVYQRWGDAAPTTVRAKARYWSSTVVAAIRGDAGATAQQRRQDLEALWADGGTFCYRDGRPIKRFVTLPPNGLVIEDRRLGRSLVTMTLRQEQYEEGVIPGGIS